MVFGISKKELKLALFFIGLGFITTMKNFITWYNGLTPFEGLLVSYLTYGIVIFLITHLIGLKIADLKIRGSMKQILGLLFITFSFFIVTDFGESCWSSYVVHGSCNQENTLNLLIATEDGSTFAFWSSLFPSLSPYVWAILTYILTPGLLSIIGAMFLEEKQIRLVG